MANLSSKVFEDLGIASFTIDEEKFRLAQAIKKDFQWRWRDKLLADYSSEEIGRANLRTICMDEIVLDYEDNESAEKGKKKLEEEGFKYEAFASGSRGQHLHAKFNNLKDYPEKVRNYIRKQLLLYFDSDITKAAEGTLISIAGRNHWKTGTPKTHLSGKIEDNTLPKFIKTELPQDEEIKNESTDGPKAIQEPCPALKRILEEGVGEGNRNNMRANIVLYYYKEKGLDKKETVQKVLEWNKLCSPPEEEQQVLKTALNTIDHAEYNVGCQSWKSHCPFASKDGEIEKHKCAWIKRYKGWLEDLEYEGIPIAEEESEEDFVNPIPKDHLITRWIDHMAGRTDAYPEYNLGGMLALLSIITKRRVAIQVSPDEVYTNLWIMLIGNSTVSRKSTCVNAIKRMAIRIQLAEHICPDDFTPEALIKILQSNGQRIYIQEEFEEFFGQLSKDYKAGLAGTFCKLYESEPNFSRELANKSQTASNVFLPILTATTVETFKGSRKIDEHTKNGFFARFLFLFPKRKKTVKKLSVFTPEQAKDYEDIRDWLESLNKVFDDIDANDIVKVTIEKEALDLYNSWNERMETDSLTSYHEQTSARFLGRLYQSVLKIAFLHHIGRPEYKDILKGGLKQIQLISLSLHKQKDKTSSTPIYNREEKDFEDNNEVNGKTEEKPENNLTSPNREDRTISVTDKIVIKPISYDITNQSLISSNKEKNNIDIYIDSSSSKLISDSLVGVKPFFVICLEDMKIAIDIAERFFIPFFERFLSDVQGIGTNSDKVFQAIVSQYTKDKQKPVPHSVALRNSNLESFEFKRAITTLVQSKRVREIEKDRPKHSQHIPTFYIPLDPDGLLKIGKKRNK